MSEKDDNSLIGYDPLAWMHEPNAQKSESAPWVEEAGSNEWLEPNQKSVIENNDQDLTTNEPLIDEAEAWILSVPAEQTQQIVLEPAQTIQNVNQLHEQFLHALDIANKIEIDASAITHIDTATLQLLLILKQTAIKLQKQVMIDFPSEKFIEAASLLGIAGMLEVDQSAAGFF